MKWVKRLKEINALKDKYRKDRYKVPFPDLSVEQRTAPLGNMFGDGRTPARKQPSDAIQFPVAHLHKQGLQLMTPDDVKHNLQHFGGKKP